MSAAQTQRPFVTQLRSRVGIVSVAGGTGARLTVRVELQDQWDTVAFDVASDAPVTALKRSALAAFGLPGVPAEDYVLKLRGVEVLAEGESLEENTARDGSSFLLSHRRRRPVR
ncbi:MAG: hypothetical protein NTZ43_01605 [Gemmatimonadetes bacterium]|nr:hypothetical protein [Gemmatimonadota bacterium]